jgi:hypothetical protein
VLKNVQEQLSIGRANFYFYNHLIFNIMLITDLYVKTTGGRLTEIHLIEIVFFQLIETFIIS